MRARSVSQLQQAKDGLRATVSQVVASRSSAAQAHREAEQAMAKAEDARQASVAAASRASVEADEHAAALSASTEAIHAQNQLALLDLRRAESISQREGARRFAASRSLSKSEKEVRDAAIAAEVARGHSMCQYTDDPARSASPAALNPILPPRYQHAVQAVLRPTSIGSISQPQAMPSAQQQQQPQSQSQSQQQQQTLSRSTSAFLGPINLGAYPESDGESQNEATWLNYQNQPQAGCFNAASASVSADPKRQTYSARSSTGSSTMSSLQTCGTGASRDTEKISKY